MKVTISSTVAKNSIPADLIVNWDQRGMRMVPVNDWTMTTRCSKVWSRPLETRETSFSAVNVHFEIGLGLSSFWITHGCHLSNRFAMVLSYS